MYWQVAIVLSDLIPVGFQRVHRHIMSLPNNMKKVKKKKRLKMSVLTLDKDFKLVCKRNFVYNADVI